VLPHVGYWVRSQLLSHFYLIVVSLHTGLVRGFGHWGPERDPPYAPFGAVMPAAVNCCNTTALVAHAQAAL